MTKFSHDINIFIREFSKELSAQNVAIFAGAGLSVPAGYVNWRGLLKNVIDELGLDADSESDLVSAAQYHCNENAGNRSQINKALIDEFGRSAAVTENHKILARLPVYTFWTTNYDKLIERSIEAAGKVADVKYTIDQLAITRPRRDAVVYKMHGDVDHPSDAVITKDDYESYHIKKAAFIENLSGDLVSKTFLFIGFSFADPNLDYVLARIRARYTQHQRRHYCFLRKVSRSDSASDSEHDYARRKQELFIGDLKRFNIKAVIVDEYCQITDILTEIERISKARTVFISGSAHEYGAWGRDISEQFLRKLSAELIGRGLRIVSGFGLGVGSAVIAGALEQTYITLRESAADKLILRPFPQQQNGVDYSELRKQYREEMCSLAGIAIFVFGNKYLSEKVVHADGVRREFDIAKDRGLFLLPVGATGYLSGDLWRDVNNNFDFIFGKLSVDIRSDFDVIGDGNRGVDDICAAVIRIVDRLTRR